MNVGGGVAARGERSGPERVDATAGPGVGRTVTRALRAEYERARARRGGAAVRVLDVGGGSGVWAVPAAEAGCQVTVVDTSPDALAALRGRAARAGVADRVRAVQGDAQALTEAVPAAEFDLVLGHGLLEVVDDLAVTVGQLADAVVPGGALSVLVAGRHAAAVAQAHSGRLAQARAVLDDPEGRWGPSDPLQRRLDASGLRGLLESAAGLSIEVLQGDGLFHGWVPAAVAEADPVGLEDLEVVMSATPDLLVLATRLHVMARRPG
jgi:S-adenosylmethionine-dependent methyltransferase